MILVNIMNVSLSNMGFVIFLRGRTDTDKRTLPIFIGIPEAQAIALHLDHVTVPRPLTHDLLKTVMDNLECRMKRAEICALRENTFFAKLILEWNGVESEIDARPSDAIALALRFTAPIYVAEEVMETAGVILDETTGSGMSPNAVPPHPRLAPVEALKQKLDKAVAEERYEDAAALRDELKKLSQTN
ncbi:MAG: bifunctional nuclease family protein [Kiritimatiellaeota bacterium]|nr:bifunctional nuclease family protein [Kiritimatiellota bacterium]